MIRLAGVDVGKHQDHTALVSLQVFQEENYIFVDFAKRYKRKTEYALIEDDMARLQKNAKWDHVGVEINGPGSVLIEHLKLKGIPVRPITTSGKITDIKKLHDYTKMSKPAMAKWMLMAKQQHKIKYPDIITNQFIKELIKQNEHFKEHITDSGATQYFAEGRTTHDDLTMALMVACRLSQRWIRFGGKHIGGIIPKKNFRRHLVYA